ncbi:hypothetical protein QZH41_006671 [Actinostola sp. cb2023]|nr:hypothetical protein QZH41_006671 [Actinostola sp. cb2023]
MSSEVSSWLKCSHSGGVLLYEESTRERVFVPRNVVPLLKYVRGEALSQDHWLELFRFLKMPKGTTLEKLTFGDVLEVSDLIVTHADALKELNSRAQGEVSIREALRELELWGAGAVFALTSYVDSSEKELSIIKDWKDLVNQVGDNQCLLQSLKDSPYYKGFEDKASIWEGRLADLDEYLHNLNQIQRKWVYLEPIFGRGALPREQGRFQRVNDDFRFIRFFFSTLTLIVSILFFRLPSNQICQQAFVSYKCFVNSDFRQPVRECFESSRGSDIEVIHGIAVEAQGYRRS